MSAVLGRNLIKMCLQLATEWNIFIAKVGSFSQAFFLLFLLTWWMSCFHLFPSSLAKGGICKYYCDSSTSLTNMSLLLWNRSSSVFKLAYVRKALDMNIRQIFKNDLTGYKFSECTDHQNLIPDLPRRLLGNAENKKVKFIVIIIESGPLLWVIKMGLPFIFPSQVILGFSILSNNSCFN